MKHLLLAILLITITSCQAQKKQSIYYPKVDNKFEKFNFEEYKDEYEISDYGDNNNQFFSLIKKVNDNFISIQFTKNKEI